MFSTKKIALDKSLYERLTRLAGEAGYASVRDLVVHVLERAAQHLEQAKDEDEVRKRLQGLGYID